jgi:hypothetical protein
MQQQLLHRLQALKKEYASGQKVLANLEAQKLKLHETLLRIGGAIQVLEEELARSPMLDSPEPSPPTSDRTDPTPTSAELSLNHSTNRFISPLEE